MSADRRGWRIDLFALCLFALGLAVALAVFSYEPAALIALQAPESTNNILGEPGAWLARELYQSLGVAVYVLLASWFVLVLLLLMRQSWQSWLRWTGRLAGWLLLLPCAAVA